MQNNKQVNGLTATPPTYIPQLTLDCVILGFQENQLRVLLLRWKDTQEWSLPGGPIHQAESIDTAANRVLQERTRLNDIYLQQFHVFGKAVRYDRAEIQAKLGHLIEPQLWYERAVTIGYYALVDPVAVTPTPDAYTDECQWWNIDAIPGLLFDHNHIIALALQALRVQLGWQPIGYTLLPDEFTMPELQCLYETILGHPLDRRNFQKKMLSLNILVRTEKRRLGGAYKSPYLYRFDRSRYEEVLKEGKLMFM